MKHGMPTYFIAVMVLGALVISPVCTVRAATIDVYMADPEVRIAQKLYVQISDTVASDRLLVALDGTIICDRVGPLASEEIVSVSYSALIAGEHTLIVKIVDADGSDASNIFTRTWRTLHNGIPTVSIDENNSIRVNGELYFPVYAPVERTSTQWVSDSLMNTTFTLDYRHPNHWDYTIADYQDWLNTTFGLNSRNIGPAARWQGIGRRLWIDPGTGDTLVIVNGHGHGNDLVIMQNYVTTLRAHPGLLMWQWSDEPDCGGVGNRAEPEEIRLWTDTCHQYDTNHPHAVNLGAYHYGRDDSWSVNLCREFSYLYGPATGHHSGQRKAIADIIGFDFYPIEYGSMRDYGGLDVGFESMARALDRIRNEYNHDLFPIFSWNENCDLHPEYTDAPACPGNRDYCPEFCSFDTLTCDTSSTRCDGCCPEDLVRCTPGVNCPASTRGACRNSPPYYQWTPPPTADQMWAEYWIKVIHGVKGFQIHAAFSSDCVGYNSGTGGQPPRNAATMQKFLTWMNDLTSAVLGPDYSGTVSHQETGGARIDVMAKVFEGVVYIIAASLSQDQSETVQFTMDMPAQGSVEVYGESRTISVDNNTFTDSFESLGVHIYKYTPMNSGVPNVPSQFYIYQNYPNPFNPYTKIDFFVATRGNIRLVIFDMLGRQIRTLVDGIVEAGLQTVSWDGRDTQGKTVSSGVYFYQLKRRPDFTNTQKMIFLK